MNNPGIYSLGDFTITTAGTQIGDWTTTDLAGALSMAAQLRFAWGSGGTTVTAYLQTSLDEGTTAVDVACVVFGVAAETEILNLSALTPKTTQVTPSDGALTNDTAVDGILGDRFRVKLVSVGTYANTVLSARVCVR